MPPTSAQSLQYDIALEGLHGPSPHNSVYIVKVGADFARLGDVELGLNRPNLDFSVWVSKSKRGSGS